VLTVNGARAFQKDSVMW